MNAAAAVESHFELASGGLRLFGRTLAPAVASSAHARLVIIHGYGEHTGRYLPFMRYLAERGIICHGIDLRGHGQSDGRRGFIHAWDDYLTDVQSLLDYAREQNQTSALPIFALGHSHGGLIAAAAGERGLFTSAGIAGCILGSPYLATLVPPPRSKVALARLVGCIVPFLRVKSNLHPEWLTSDQAMLDEDKADKLMNRCATPRWFFTMRPTQRRTLAEAKLFSLPVLCLIGQRDLIADPAAVFDFYDHCSAKDKSIYTYAGCPHELLREKCRDTIYADIFGWLSARLPKRQTAAAKK